MSNLALLRGLKSYMFLERKNCFIERGREAPQNYFTFTSPAMYVDCRSNDRFNYLVSAKLSLVQTAGASIEL